MKNNRIIVISDVDGCLTDGGLYYTSEGKVMKRFGVGDHEGLKLLKKNNIDVEFITADKTGFDIVSKRMKDMSNSKLIVKNEIERLEYIKNLHNDYDIVVFFGDGLGDVNVKIKNACDYFICPLQSRIEVKYYANYITSANGGNGAFLDMAIWVVENLLKNYKVIYE